MGDSIINNPKPLVWKEEQIAKRYVLTSWRCANCDEKINVLGRQNRCHECGQKIDWEMLEKKY